MSNSRNGSAEAFFLCSALIGVVLAALVSRIPWLGFSFLQFLAVMLSVDVMMYVTMKVGWVKSPGQRRGDH